MLFYVTLWLYVHKTIYYKEIEWSAEIHDIKIIGQRKQLSMNCDYIGIWSLCMLNYYNNLISLYRYKFKNALTVHIKCTYILLNLKCRNNYLSIHNIIYFLCRYLINNLDINNNAIYIYITIKWKCFN